LSLLLAPQRPGSARSGRAARALLSDYRAALDARKAITSPDALRPRGCRLLSTRMRFRRRHRKSRLPYYVQHVAANPCADIRPNK
jgi:hypothetical protein